MKNKFDIYFIYKKNINKTSPNFYQYLIYMTIEYSKKLINTINGKQKMSFIVRPNTTDSKVIDEIIDRKTYQHQRLQFNIKSDDVWLDLGANIGVFSVLVISQGSKVYSYEPESENYNILKKNISKAKKEFKNTGGRIYKQGVDIKSGKVNLYLAKKPENKYRHTIIAKKGRNKVTINVNTLDYILSKHKDVNAIKMDIEGIEIMILEQFDRWGKYNIKKLVFEYSFDIDPSIARFKKIINKLKKHFKTVHFTKVKLNEKFYKYFPPQTIVFCK